MPSGKRFSRQPKNNGCLSFSGIPGPIFSSRTRIDKLMSVYLLEHIQRVHNRFGGMRHLAIQFVVKTRDAGTLITSGSGIFYFYGDGMRES